MISATEWTCFAVTGVDFKSICARPINVNIVDIPHYHAYARGKTGRCTFSTDGVIIGFGDF